MATLSQIHSDDAITAANLAKLDARIEVIVIPVSDVDRAKEFYTKLGWRLDADLRFDNGIRVVQLTPHGSACSVQFGAKLTSAAPGSGLGYVIVSDIESARTAMIEAGVQVGEVFHIGPKGPVPGPDPEHRSYFSRALFSDPDDNNWLLQEVTARLPGRIEPGATSYSSASELASALRRAAAAHGQHEARLGQADKNWPDWYAEYMFREQAGTELPT